MPLSDTSQPSLNSAAPEGVPLKLTPLPAWDMYTVAVSLGVGYLFMPLLLSNVLLLANPFLSPAALLIVQQGMTLLTWVGIFVFLRLRYGPIVDCFGLKPQRPLAFYLWETILLLLLTTGLTILLPQLWGLLSQWFPQWNLAQTEPYQNFRSSEILVLSGFAVLMAPMLEEMIFRGFVQATFHKFANPFRSVLFTCLVFLLFHGNYFENVKALTHVFALGLCFGIWRERTQSLYPSMVVHLFNNSLASIVMLMHH
jgi:membrane protease YdiL (CAAX protease family)